MLAQKDLISKYTLKKVLRCWTSLKLSHWANLDLHILLEDHIQESYRCKKSVALFLNFKLSQADLEGIFLMDHTHYFLGNRRITLFST